MANIVRHASTAYQMSRNLDFKKGMEYGRKIYNQLGRLRSAARTPVIEEVTVVNPPKRAPKTKKRVMANKSADQSKQGSITVISREEVVDSLRASEVGESLRSFVISPENHITFPWLSNIVTNWTQYRFKKVWFTFTPTVGQFSPSGAVGSLVLGYDPDVSDSSALLTSKLQILGLQFSREKRLDKDNSISTNAGRLLSWYDVGSISVDTEQFSDLGILYTDVSGTDLADGKPVGTLKVHYTIEMRIPRISTTKGAFGNFYNANTTSSAAGARLNPVGMGSSPYNSIRSEVVSFDTNTMTIFDTGNWFLLMNWAGSNIGTNPTLTLGAGVTEIEFFYGTNPYFNYYSEGLSQAVIGYAVHTDRALSPGGCHLTVAGLTGMVNAFWNVVLFRLPDSMGGQMSAMMVLKQICKRLNIQLPKGIGIARIQELEM